MRFDATTGHGGTETTTALAGAGQAGVAVLLAANHISMIDVFVILGALRREVQRRITTLEAPVSGT